MVSASASNLVDNGINWQVKCSCGQRHKVHGTCLEGMATKKIADWMPMEEIVQNPLSTLTVPFTPYYE